MPPIHPALLSRSGKEQLIKTERVQYIVSYLTAHPEATKQQLTTHLQEKFNVCESTAYRWGKLAREYLEHHHPHPPVPQEQQSPDAPSGPPRNKQGR